MRFAVAHAIAGTIPFVERAIVQVHRTQRRGLALGKHFHRMLGFQFGSNDQLIERHVVFENFDCRRLQPIVPECNSRLPVANVVTGMPNLDALPKQCDS